MPRTQKRKGASQVFEQVLLFAIGVGIFMFCFGAFTAYESYFSSMTAQDQVRMVGLLTESNIIELAESDSYGSVRLKVCAVPSSDCLPREIGGKGYRITLSNLGLLVDSDSGASYTSSLFGLNETLEMSGSVFSAAGDVIIYRTGNKIIIT